MSLVSVWFLLLLLDALIPVLNQTENQSFMPRVVKAPEVYEILRSFRDAFVCLSFVPGYFHKVGNSLWRDCSGVYMCVREYLLSPISVSIQTS